MPTQDRADRTGASGPIRLLENAELLLRGERPAVGAVGHLGIDRHGGWPDGWPSGLPDRCSPQNERPQLGSA